MLFGNIIKSLLLQSLISTEKPPFSSEDEDNEEADELELHSVNTELQSNSTDIILKTSTVKYTIESIVETTESLNRTNISSRIILNNNKNNTETVPIDVLNKTEIVEIGRNCSRNITRLVASYTELNQIICFNLVLSRSTVNCVDRNLEKKLQEKFNKTHIIKLKPIVISMLKVECHNVTWETENDESLESYLSYLTNNVLNNNKTNDFKLCTLTNATSSSKIKVLWRVYQSFNYPICDFQSNYFNRISTVPFVHGFILNETQTGMISKCKL